MINPLVNTPARVGLFNDIASFLFEQLPHPDEPAAKRRRVDSGPPNGEPSPQPANGAPGYNLIKLAESAAKEPVLLEIKEISVSIPQRKKYDICFTQSYLYARTSGTTTPVQGIVYPWKDIEYAFYVPVPEKAQLQYNYVLFPQGTCVASAIKNAPPSDIEPFLFTVPSSAPKANSVGGSAASAAAAVSDSYSSLLHWAITTQLRTAGNKHTQIIATDPRIFHSVQRQAHRPNERAVHVKGFRGSKDGYLFFLPNGILWGFKKPLLFMPIDRIQAVSYTSVLQRTFNIVVDIDVSDKAGEEKTEEVEFAMLDQEDYAGIDESWVKRHGLQDRSMAERRKAKRELAENAKGAKKGDAANGADANGHDDDMTELQKAQLEAEQQLIDEEDEEDEEDYDPGSEGESEGEGGSSDEDEDEAEGYDEEEEEEGYAEDVEQ
ncbi:putative negative regulator of dna transposition protein [Phaeoacremonium minimum UCRPA7]|uniref:Putative negative regulator of dna transposition protein n=1 Tax=Phaeoacremonium minimum (strain UCR-PA7) TaxID=1286976 RepID=R8B8V8_PHAM7|nr:putative negative regulator of dna transposition protein [Phaeoacremonium minimum UCRPA7]EON95712.1 putative negative regulator of dna transposition protein [Phaeoacremonium minimum UCRPA7]